MALPWETLDRVVTPEGPLELRRRGRDFLITIAGRVLMTSSARRSEEDLARIAVAAIAHPSTPSGPRKLGPDYAQGERRILLGGLGMGFTLRAALDALSPRARVVVAELTPQVAAWCRGPMKELTGDALADPRVEVRIGDVAAEIQRARAEYDAIVLDLYEGPNAATQRDDDPFYGTAALAAARRALRPGGALAIWSEDPDRAFEERFARAGFRTARHRGGKGGRVHIVYTGVVP